MNTYQSQPRPMIFLHGAGVSAAWWHPQLDQLKDEFQVIAPDLPGHGTLVHEPFSLTAAVQHVLEVMDESAIDRAMLVGISMGGYVAIEFAYRHTGRVVGLVLSGCTMNLSGMQGIGMAVAGLILRLRGATWLEQAQLKSFRNRISPEILDPVLTKGFFAKSAIQAIGATCLRNYHRKVTHLTQPILVLNGEQDTPNRNAEPKFLGRAPHARIIKLDKAGHLCNLEQPSDYTSAVREFGRSITWSSGR